MPDPRIYVVKNTRRLPTRDKNTGEATDVVEEYITRMTESGSKPVGFLKEDAIETAEALKLGEDAVIVAPDDMVVTLDHRARKLPQAEPEHLKVMQQGPVNM